MRKKFTIFLILIFLLGLVPINFSTAITQNQIDAEVQIVCTDGTGNWYGGSGTIIDSKGIILTNRHVVEGAYNNVCFIGFFTSISQEPNFGPEGNRNLAEVKYVTATNDMDAAVLYLDNKDNKSYPFVNIWNSSSNNLKFGDKIEVVGYPSVGGSNITYTSGDFSGFGSKLDGLQNYIKTTIWLEHGNSGGSAYNQGGEFIGIPSMAITGSINSMSYILSVDSIKNWLSGILGNQYQQQIIEQKPVIEQPITSIQDDITPPDIKGYNIKYKIINNNESKISNLQFYWDSKDIISKNQIKKYYYVYSNNVSENPIENGNSFTANNNGINFVPETFIIDGATDKHLIIKIQDENGNISSSIITPWSNEEIITDGKSFNIYSEYKENFKYQDTNVFKKYSGYFVKNNNMIWFVGPKDKKIHLIQGNYNNDSYDASRLNQLFCNSEVSTGITSSDLAKKPRHVWGHLLITVGLGQFSYIHPTTGIKYDFSSIISWLDEGKDIFKLIGTLALNISDEDLSKLDIANPLNDYYIEHEMIPLYVDGILEIIDNTFAKKQTGKILLQVEAHGEAYYVYPKDSKRYYMANGNEAYRIMRYLGVGITNKDLNRVMADKIFAKKHSGKIFLQVEANGEAYYIDFDGEEHYLKDGSAAYNIMRDLGLGITNNDLNKIPEGNL